MKTDKYFLNLVREYVNNYRDHNWGIEFQELESHIRDTMRKEEIQFYQELVFEELGLEFCDLLKVGKYNPLKNIHERNSSDLKKSYEIFDFFENHLPTTKIISDFNFIRFIVSEHMDLIVNNRNPNFNMRDYNAFEIIFDFFDPKTMEKKSYKEIKDDFHIYLANRVSKKGVN
jgi:hypothetical protein